MWTWLEPLLPDRTPRRGGRWRDHREVLEAIAWRYRTGSPWREDLPEEFGPWQSVYDRHVRWSCGGTYDRIFAAAHTAADGRDLDWPVAADSSLMRVHQHGATARRLTGNAATVSEGHGGEQVDASKRLFRIQSARDPQWSSERMR